MVSYMALIARLCVCLYVEQSTEYNGPITVVDKSNQDGWKHMNARTKLAKRDMDTGGVRRLYDGYKARDSVHMYDLGNVGQNCTPPDTGA